MQQEATTVGAERNVVLAELEQMHQERYEVLQQIEPLSKQVEELKEGREISELLGECHRKMMRDLMKRAQRVCARLDENHLGVPNAF